MIPSPGATLTHYLIEERRRFPRAGGTLNGLILDVSLACKSVARVVALGRLNDPGAADAASTGADAQGRAERRPLGLVGNEIFIQMSEWNGYLAGMASGNQEQPLQIGARYRRGHYLLLFDPLDGSDNIDVNGSAGSIFSILQAPPPVVEKGLDVTAADFLQPGTTQVAAGYAIYGPATMLVLSVGNGVVGFTLNPDLGEFILTHPAIRVPPETREFAIDTSNSRFWEPPIKRYVEECLAGRTGVRGKDFNMRWIASLVAEAHRILLRGGVFLAPRDSKDPAQAGRMQLLYEANPIGFVVEQAGGRASTGRQPLLGITPSALHQRVGLVFGSRHEVERIERYHTDPANRERAAPLFGERSLFRE
ncbi:MAG TPA: class 1 fructose-bisphosphatase [Steroidobacteraceae bacterium]|nr:class 1 fructose-bisphosphatase [Steroidobacteraceae bacterium]